MIELRPFEKLGRFDNDWLSARYHFSFADYFDPARAGLGVLRVWNDDRIKPKSGFPPHGHRDMEIITYIRRGAVTHEDHLGNRGRTAAGDVQVRVASWLMCCQPSRMRASVCRFLRPGCACTSIKRYGRS